MIVYVVNDYISLNCLLSLCSLLSLSRVIHALSLPPRKRPKFISYRDSKLTRILQPSLSGNAHTAIICCASNARAHLEETRSTLKFAASAKRITVEPVLNETVEDPYVTIARLQQELAQAHETIRRLQAEVQSIPTPCHVEPLRDPSVMAVVPPMELLDTEEDPWNTDTQPAIAWAATDDSDSSSEAVLVKGTFELEEVSYTEHVETCQDSQTTTDTGRPPIAEIVILHEHTKQHKTDCPGTRIEDAEQRALFLENKLEATDDLVETLFRDLKSVRRETFELNALREQLETRIAQYQVEIEEKVDDNDVLMQQHLLLKYGIYGGLALYVCGYHESFMAVIVFMWLSLELVT
jgi:hypothetical protein